MAEIMSKGTKGLEKLRELLDSELGDYGFQWKVELDDSSDDTDYYSVSISREYGNDITKTISFKYEKENSDDKEEKLFVELGEDIWEEVDDFTWRVKYFWMAFLKWDF